MRRSVRVTGCSWPARSPRPGSVTSIASAASAAASARALERVAARVERRRERGLRRVDRLARRRESAPAAACRARAAAP